MNIIEIMERFPNQESCVEFLESIRFKDGAYCPLCGSTHVAKRNDSHNHVGRWNCHDCKSTFKAVQGTVFHGTKIPLQKWFLAITIMANAKKSLSSCQLSRDINVTQQSSLYMMHRIRAEMASKNDILLQGVIEADETYVGGKPRKPNKRDDDDKPENQNPRGRGTAKAPVIGAVERDGNVVAQPQDDLSGKGILNFIMNSIKPDESVLITDEYQAYNATNNFVKREVIKHQERYVNGHIHTNTIEGFWGLLKRAWYGQHHHYRKQYLPLYVAEACYKYNQRKTENVFDHFIHGCFA